MINFFPPPFPFFKSNLYNTYKPYSAKKNKINDLSNNEKNYNNFLHKKSQTPEINNNSEVICKTDLNNKNEIFKSVNSNSNNNNFYLNNNINSKTRKNSITNDLKSNTISSIFPQSLYNFIPNNFGPLNININGFSNTNEPIFELFGIKLYLDDIIIICILIFLYQEDVKDEILYIILIMLLFS